MSKDIIKNFKAVILVGSRDFGRCPLASRLNRALWPVFGQPAIQRLLDQLRKQGIERFVVSCENRTEKIENSVTLSGDASVIFRHERLPRGPAGCIFDAAEESDELFLVIPAGIVNPPDVSELISLHADGKADMTVFLNPSQGENQEPKESRMYLCNRSVLECIPEAGFFDLKEGLVPAMVHSGKRIHGAQISECPGNFRNWRQYLAAVKFSLSKSFSETLLDDKYCRRDGEADNIWVGENVSVDASAKLMGPIVVGDDTVIGPNAMIAGPSVLGSNVTIGAGSIVEESVIWDYAAVERGTHIKSSLIDSKKTILRGNDVTDDIQALPAGGLSQLVNEVGNLRVHSKEEPANRVKRQTDYTLGEMISGMKGRWLLALSSFLVLVALILSYWDPTLKRVWRIWLINDEYSSGLLVPIVSVYVIWLRRRDFLSRAVQPCFWGLLSLIAFQGMRYFGLYLRLRSVEQLSFVLSVGAVVLLVFGWSIFKKFIPIFLFLFLMLPLPNSFEEQITLPLQNWATVSAVFCLETAGFSVIQEGNVININGTLVAVAEACNGLRMLTAFVVVSGLVTLVTHRKWWEKAIILISSIPIALICNTLRLTITAYFFTILDTETWEQRFHDFGGFAMMPIALLMIVFELWLLSQLVIEPKKEVDEQIIYRKKP
jgi:exosortase